MVAELKKGRYVYYHCTGHRGKCPEPYTRQEALIDEFAGVLGELVVPREVLDWLAQEVSSHRPDPAGRARSGDQAVRSGVWGDCGTASTRSMRIASTVGITKALYDEKSKTTQEQIANVERKLAEPVAQCSRRSPPRSTYFV